MIIKKFQAETEKEATLMAKENLGPDAIVMNIKTIKPKGLFRSFRKSKVELTAAIDENTLDKKIEPKKDTRDNKEGSYRFGNAFAVSNNEYSEEAQNAIEEKINNIARLLEQQVATPNVKAAPVSEEIVRENPVNEENANTKEPEQGKSKVIELIKKQLLENEVYEKYVDAIIDELENKSEEQPLDNVLSNIYQKIVLKLGEIEPLECGENKPKIVFFVGNTGVGKTTTMAKLASKFKLEKKLDIAMFSVDTYRIAAIEQIKTYANILSTPMEVVYTPDDMRSLVEKYNSCDLIFVDTAGRSHKNLEQKNDLASIIDCVKDEYECEVFLVVSATTKYNDLKSIADVYGNMFDYKFIFTKLDETRGLGNILNLRLDTEKALSYVTWGQNVPDDIGVLNPQVIAKKLLGGEQ